ncbi:MAG TPA: M56 family metallopeptidase, partial [Lacipirellulaceae bacterium]|nr:M56 family metallopeptidase [Lacipirellulaceae bacterium]
MSHAIQSYAQWLADYYLLSTALLALTLIAIAVLKQPAQRLAVAKSSFVALILLALLVAAPGWSVVHLLTSAPTKPFVHSTLPDSATPTIASDQLPRIDTDPVVVSNPNIAPPLPPGEGPGEGTLAHISWPTIFAIVHSSGAACVFAWLLLGWLAALRLCRTALPAPPHVSAILHQLIESNHARPNRVQLFTHTRIDVPVALGIWHPTIVLPVSFIEGQHDRRLAQFAQSSEQIVPVPQNDRGLAGHHRRDGRAESAEQNVPVPLAEREITSILAHESTHIANRDLQWVALARILLVALWANPLFWLTRRRLRLDQESLADAAAAQLTTRQQYAEQLVAWARNISTFSALNLSSAVGLWERPSQLRQRVAILLNDRITVLRNCSRRWRFATVILALGAAIGLSLITMQPAHTAPPPHSNSDHAATPNPPPTGTLTIRFEYDGTPPAPKEIKEGGWRNKLDNRVMRTFNVEKRVGAKVFDESLVVGEDRGIANVLVWVRSRDIPVPSPQELPPVTITYEQGRLSPHVLAFQSPRRLVMRNEGNEACGFQYVGGGFSLLVQKGKEASFVIKPVRIPEPIASIIEHWRSGSGYVLPLAHPFVAVSDKHGVGRIENLPPGNWEFQVWHERPGW